MGKIQYNLLDTSKPLETSGWKNVVFWDMPLCSPADRYHYDPVASIFRTRSELSRENGM
jgi:hypothetical protein